MGHGKQTGRMRWSNTASHLKLISGGKFMREKEIHVRQCVRDCSSIAFGEDLLTDD